LRRCAPGSDESGLSQFFDFLGGLSEHGFVPVDHDRSFQQPRIFRNLKHARERQVSKSRSEALQRVKNKDAEMREVLTRDQYIRLQDKRYERYPSTSTQFNRPDIQQRTQPVQERTAPAEQRQIDPNQRRTVAPTDNRSRQVVPQRTIPSAEQRVIVPRQPSSSERPDFNQRRVPIVPQARPTPAPEQNRSTRSTPSSSSNSSGNNRPARR